MASNPSYLQIDRVSDIMTKQTEKRLISNYKKSLTEIKKQMAEVYEKYEINGKLTREEMAKYNRLNLLFENINKEVYALTGVNNTLIKRLASDIFHENYFRTGFLLEKEAEAKLSFGLLNPKTIQASVENPIAGLTLSETLQKNRVNIVSQLRSNITQGLVLGESYSKMATRITTTLQNDIVKAIRVVRTEGHRNATAGRLASYEHAEDMGLDLEYMWMSTIDARTRDQHQTMDGQIANRVPQSQQVGGKRIEFTFPDGTTTVAPGMSGAAHHDINCRCTIRSFIKGFEPKFRRIRGEGVVPYQTYGEWAEANEIPMKYKGPEPKVHETFSDVKWARSTAQELTKRAAQNEVAITELMKQQAGLHGARLEGLKYVLKGEDSLMRKLRSDYREKINATYDDVKNSMGDIVRYTMLVDEKNYLATVNSIYNSMHQMGYSDYKFKNYWSPDTSGSDLYKGINSNWISKSGQKFELQFHTERSFKIKETLSHPIYERMRVATDPIIKQRCGEELIALWRTCKVPTGMMSFKPMLLN